MSNKKATPAKRKYVKKSATWDKKEQQEPEEQLQQEAQPVKALTHGDNPALVAFIKQGVDRLNVGDKARILSYIVGNDSLDDRELWAIGKLLSK